MTLRSYPTSVQVMACSLTHLPRVVSRIEQFWGVQPKVGSHKDGGAKGADGIGSGEGAGPPPHKSVKFLA